MGLSICRSVVESLHGALEALPSPLGGAQLSFTLPIASGETPA
jgi:signal transduction histidine kinase